MKTQRARRKTTKRSKRRLNSSIRGIGTIAAFVVVAVAVLACLNGFLLSSGSYESSQSTSAQEQNNFAEEEITDDNDLSNESIDQSDSLDNDSNSNSDETTNSSGDSDTKSESGIENSQNDAAPEENKDDAQEDVESVPNESTARASVQMATVERVVDGDTLSVNINGASYKVRLIGVDTPESVNPDESKNTQEGIVASDFTKSLISAGQTVYLQKDISETDDYGRLLRYVWLDDPGTQAYDSNYVAEHMLNGILVYQGYAEAKQYPPDTAYADIFAELQNDAVRNGRGVSYLWSGLGQSVTV